MRAAVLLTVVAGAVLGFDDRDLAREIAMGKGLAADLEKQYRVLADGEVQGEVARIGQKLVAELPEGRLPFQFKVLVGESAPPMNECWGLPGGFVHVPSGLILRAQSEAELAGMIVHTLIHVAQRHGAQTRNRDGIALYWAWQPYGMYPKEVEAQWREFEIAADAGAAPVMARAGYDPRALLAYLERNNAPAERLAMLRDGVRAYTTGGFAADDYRFANLQATVRKVSTVGDRPKAPSLRNPERR